MDNYQMVTVKISCVGYLEDIMYTIKRYAEPYQCYAMLTSSEYLTSKEPEHVFKPRYIVVPHITGKGIEFSIPDTIMRNMIMVISFAPTKLDMREWRKKSYYAGDSTTNILMNRRDTLLNAVGAVAVLCPDARQEVAVPMGEDIPVEIKIETENCALVTVISRTPHDIYLQKPPEWRAYSHIEDILVLEGSQVIRGVKKCDDNYAPPLPNEALEILSSEKNDWKLFFSDEINRELSSRLRH